MGGLRKKLPWTHGVFFVCWLAICGIVLFSGFFSKDSIIAGAFATEVFGERPRLGRQGWSARAHAGGAGHRVLHVAPLLPGVLGRRDARRRRDQAPHPRVAARSWSVRWWCWRSARALGGFIGLPGGLVDHPELEPARPRARAGARLPELEVPHGIEIGFMVGVDGAGGARHRRSPGLLRRRLPRAGRARSPPQFPGFVRLVQDKFRIDELYDLLLIRPIRAFSRGLFASSTASSSTRSWSRARACWSTCSRGSRAPSRAATGSATWRCSRSAWRCWSTSPAQPTLPFDQAEGDADRAAPSRSTRAAAAAPRPGRSSTRSTSTMTARPSRQGRVPGAAPRLLAPGTYTIRVDVSDPRWGTERRLQAKRSRCADGRARLDHAASPVRRRPGDAGAARGGGDPPRPRPADGAGDVPRVAADPARLRRRPGRLSAAGGQGLDRAARHPLPPGHRRHLAVAGAADDVPDAGDAAVAAGDRHPQHPRARVHRRDAGAGEPG